MAGVSDLPFRLLCREQGAGLVCMEMVSAKAILYKNRNTEELLTIDPKEHPVSLQLFGSDPDIISEIAKQIEERPFDILDLNMGCPVPKVVNNGDGSALMKNPRLAGEIIEKTARAIKKPLTVKIRKGFDDAHVNAVELAHIAQESGAAAVAVHGRTREQYYAGLLFNPVRKMLADRREKIAGELSDAANDKKDAAALKADYEARLKNIDKEAEQILSEARQKAQKNAARIESEAKEEAARIIQRANEEAELSKKRAMDDVKQEMITVASMMAAKVVAANIDASVQDALVEETLKEMGDSTWQS